MDVLKDPDAVKQLANILKTNVRAAKAVGHHFVVQVSKSVLMSWLEIILCISVLKDLSLVSLTDGEDLPGYAECL